MGVAQARKWCKDCDRYALHERHTFGGGWGCLLTILTAGLFLPVWLLIAFVQIFTSRWHCQLCGRAR